MQRTVVGRMESTEKSQGEHKRVGPKTWDWKDTWTQRSQRMGNVGVL